MLTVGDWNRDGKADVITREDAGDTLMLRTGTGNGTFAAGVLMAQRLEALRPPRAVGDVTGDRFPDLMGRRRPTGALTVFPGNGKTSFRAADPGPGVLRTFNQIGSRLLAAERPPDPTFLSSDGSFVPVAGTTGGDPTATTGSSAPVTSTANGRADLVVRDTTGTLWLLPGTATASRIDV